jgi:quinol---cytochrome c reductase iron-sulfur subunit, bacillus type
VADIPASSHAHAHTAPNDIDSAVTRSQFLTLTTVGLGAMIGAVIGVPATAYVLAPVFDEVKFEPVTLGPVSKFAADPSGQFKPIAATFVEDPSLPETSAALAWVYNTGKPSTDWLASDAMFVVFSNRCMHLGCPVRYVQAAQRFICPCHGGVYGPNGEVTGGPPVRPLDRFYTKVENGRVLVGPRFSLDSHFNRFPHPRDPSNHLDGLWQYLYPSRPTT